LAASLDKGPGFFVFRLLLGLLVKRSLLVKMEYHRWMQFPRAYASVRSARVHPRSTAPSIRVKAVRRHLKVAGFECGSSMFDRLDKRRVVVASAGLVQAGAATGRDGSMAFAG
jgi:hypothetical protein